MKTIFNKKLIIVLSLSVFSVTGCSSKNLKESSSLINPKVGMMVVGKASWYGKKFEGKKTASGDIFRMRKKTAAHRTLPFNTMVKVTNLTNNKSEIVRINDRGPLKKSRMIDVSHAVAKKIGILSSGITKVKVEILAFNGGKNDKFKVFKSSKKEDCVDCYASVSDNTPQRKTFKTNKENNGYSYRVTSSDSYIKNPDEPKISRAVVSRTPLSIKSKKSSKKIAIQIGAFRRYAGAKVYAKKYDLLSDRYKVEIKAGAKDQKPLYRVRIEGFSTRSEAKEFKRKYGLTGAFLVMK